MNSFSSMKNIPLYRPFEAAFRSSSYYSNPFLKVDIQVQFISPTGKKYTGDGFWDGGRTWKVRFMPGETGNWIYSTTCSDPNNVGLHEQSGSFTCSSSLDITPFDRHGPLRVSANRRYLEHTDGTPFFWMADTAWNGPLNATPKEWRFYLKTRKQQKFNAVQWVAAQWLGSPWGDINRRQAYSGYDRIKLAPLFFKRLDTFVETMSRAGMLSVPVMMWAIDHSIYRSYNPGLVLPEDQVIRLGRYMVARWGAYPVVWILNGDGDYRGELAERWVRIGRGIFGGRAHAPVSLHPGGKKWVQDEFKDEEWLDMIGYQSGHGGDDETVSWLVAGPASQGWERTPTRPQINLEPPYEANIGSEIYERLNDFICRRGLYYSLLVTPTCGVTYGGRGVWGWDDGTKPTFAHEGSGIPLSWKEGLFMPGAMQIEYLVRFFSRMDWWRLIPAPEMVLDQPGLASAGKTILASCSAEGDLAVVYTPDKCLLWLDLTRLAPHLEADWFNPRTGMMLPVDSPVSGSKIQLHTPGDGDWILLISKKNLE